MNTPYQLVSMAAILRDWVEEEDLQYKNIEHEYLTGIADYLYNVGGSPEELLPEYKKVYDEYGPDYFAKVIKDMEALDGQLTNDRKAQELLDDYTDRIDSGVYASKKVSASDNPFYDKLSGSGKRFVRNTEKKMTSMFSPDTFDVYNALLPYIGDYESNTGWSGSCDLMKVKDSTSADGYIYKVIWDNSSTEIDIFSWSINDNPRVNGDYTLMVMPAHGMPDFCDSENDFYRAIRKIFGGGLKKIDN